MITGGCPYCDATQMNPYAGHPALQKIVCEECHQTYWLKHSNFDPEAFTQEQFAERYEVDETTKSVVDKRATREAESRKAHPEFWAVLDRKMDEAVKIAADKMVDELLFGGPDDRAPPYDGGLASLIRD